MDLLSLGTAGWEWRSLGGLPFFLCSVLLLFLSTAPPPPTCRAPAQWRCRKVLQGLKDGFSNAWTADTGSSRSLGCPRPAGSACAPSTALHTHPVLEDILYASARGHRVTVVLRALECGTAAARARAAALSMKGMC